MGRGRGEGVIFNYENRLLSKFLPTEEKIRNEQQGDHGCVFLVPGRM